MTATAPSLKYAHVERERRYLLTGVPTHGDAPSSHIEDRYLTGTRLRLRKVARDGAAIVYKLGQKIPLDVASPSTVAHTTMYLTRIEYDALVVLPGHDLRKSRTRLPVKGQTLALDVFHGLLGGLVLAEIELGADGELPDVLPADIRAEVTGDIRFTGGALATMTAADCREAVRGCEPLD